MYAIVDIETTGTHAGYHAITEVGVVLHDGEKITGTWHSLVNPECEIPSFITQLTGIDDAMVADAPAFSDIAGELHGILHDRIFVAHNASFDYAFIKSGLEENGYEFRTKKLCTVRLSRKIFPGFRRYNLETVCRELGVSNASQHRAMGDAQATAEVFSLLLQRDPAGVALFLKRNAREQHLPPNIAKSDIENLPGVCGVYYFLNEKGEVIYVGKAKHIKNRVLGHFTFADHHGRENALRNSIYGISYTPTGNELIALLLESEEIKRKFPRYNNAQKLWDRNFCIFRYTDQQGYEHLAIERYNRKKNVVRVFPDYLSARNYLNDIVQIHRLCPKLCHLQTVKKACYNHASGLCAGACTGAEDFHAYNARVNEAIAACSEEPQSYFLIGEGRDPGEKSVVCVENGHYLGFGFFMEALLQDNRDILRDCVQWRPDTPDVQRILNGWRLRHPETVLLFSGVPA